MPTPVNSTASLRNVFRRFRANRRGSAAVEFALVAPLFFALLFAIIETAIMFFANQALESVAQNSARMIMTGQVQASGWNTLALFKPNAVCNQNLVLFSCPSISVDVQSYPTFASVSLASPIDANGNFVVPTNYSPGGPGDIVVVRFYYQWQLFVTGLGYNISNMAGSKRLLAATVAFRNEPYSGGG